MLQMSSDRSNRKAASKHRAKPSRSLGHLRTQADVNHHLRRNSPSVLDETHYSKDADEARAPVLVTWMEILSITSPSFVTEVNRSGFLASWHELVQSFVGGALLGSSRTPDDIILSKARSVASDIPWHRRSI